MARRHATAECTMRVLVVEDEPRLAAFIEKGLGGEGFRVDLAASGHEALALARTESYEVIVLDIMLPGPDGFVVCRHLRALGHDEPVLMLSARGQVEDRIKGLDIGADDYLTKPFAFAELTARVRALLRRRSPAERVVLRVGDLTLDRVRRTARRGDDSVDLTAREFTLLEYLMEHSGEVLTRAMIAQHVWNLEWDPLTNVIDVFVSHLRKKIEPPGEPRLIHAVRSVGYVIRASEPPG